MNMLDTVFDIDGLAESEVVLISPKSTLSSMSRLSPVNLKVRADVAGMFQKFSSSGLSVGETRGLCVTSLSSARSR